MKKLIINPPQNLAGTIQHLNQAELMDTLLVKIFRQGKDNWKPILTNIDHVRRFVYNIEPRSMGISDLLDHTLTTYEDALAFMNTAGRHIYGSDRGKTPNPLWSLKIVKAEIDAERSDSKVFGLNLGNAPQVLEAIQKELRLSCDIEVYPAAQSPNPVTPQAEQPQATDTSPEGTET